MIHTVLQWNERIPKHTWTDYDGDHILWPHSPLLYVLGKRFHFHVQVPGMYMPTTSLFPVAYEYNLNMRIKHEAPHGIASIRIIDTQCTPQLDKPNMPLVWWIIRYGFDEDTRFLLCTMERGETYPIRRIAALLELFGYTFSTLGMPHATYYRDYRLRLNVDVITWDETPW